MGRLGYCLPCGELRRDVDATVVIDGDPMCAACARGVEVTREEVRVEEFREALPKGDLADALRANRGEPITSYQPAGIRLCAQGCGKRAHRGLLLQMPKAGVAAAAVVEDITASTQLRRVSGLELQAGKQQELQGSRKREGYMDRLEAEEIALEEIPAEVVQAPHPRGRSGELWERFKALPEGRALKVKCRDVPHVGCTDRQLRAKARAAGLSVGMRREGSTDFCWKKAEL